MASSSAPLKRSMFPGIIRQAFSSPSLRCSWDFPSSGAFGGAPDWEYWERLLCASCRRGAPTARSKCPRSRSPPLNGSMDRGRAGHERLGASTRARRCGAALASGSCAHAHSRGLWILAVPAIRHHHIRRAVCGLCGAFGRIRRRPNRCRSVRQEACADRDRMPLGLERHLRFWLARHAERREKLNFLLDGDHFHLGRHIPEPRSERVQPHAEHRRGTVPQCVSLGLLYLGGHARTACDHRPVLVDCHAIAGGNPRIPADGQPPLLLLWPVLARARHRLDRRIYHRVLGSSSMSTEIEAQGMAPGASVHTHGTRSSYLIGLGYAVVLTLASFWASSTDVIYPPGVPILLGVLAIAQMGVHLVFFLHISSAPDQTNNILALAFGIFVVGLLVFVSMIIMAHLNHNMMPMDKLIQMQR